MGPHTALMSGRDRVDDREPEAGPTTSGAIPRSPKGFEQPLDIPRIDDVTIIRDSQVGITIPHLDHDIDDTALLVVPDRIVEQVRNEPLGEVPTAQRGSRREGAVDAHPNGRGRVRVKRDGGRDDFGEIERAGVGEPVPRRAERQQRLDEPLLLFSSGDGPLQRVPQ